MTQQSAAPVTPLPSHPLREPSTVLTNHLRHGPAAPSPIPPVTHKKCHNRLCQGGSIAQNRTVPLKAQGKKEAHRQRQRASAI